MQQTKVYNVHLQDIERPDSIGTRVRIPLVVAGVGKTFSIPSTTTIRCTGTKKRAAVCFEGEKTLRLGQALTKPTDIIRRFLAPAVRSTTPS